MSKPNQVDLQSIVNQRMRMKMALQYLPIGKEQNAKLLIDWLDKQPEIIDKDNAAELMVALHSDLKSLTWYAATSPHECMEITGDFLLDLGASQSEMELLTQAGKRIQPQALGTWFQLTLDGLDGGWYFPTETTTYHVLNSVASSADKEIMLEWAETYKVIECEQIRRSVAQSQPMTELLFLLPEVSLKEQIAIARSAFEMFQVTWFGEELELTFQDLGVEEVGLIVKLTEAGISQIGVVILEPTTELVLTLGFLSDDFSEEKLAMFEGTLDIDGVDFLIVSQNSWGLGVEFYYVF